MPPSTLAAQSHAAGDDFGQHQRRQLQHRFQRRRQLIFNNYAGGGDATINVTSWLHTISAPVQLDVNTNVTAAAGSSLAINGGVTGSGLTLSISGAGPCRWSTPPRLTDTVGFLVNPGGYRVLGSCHSTGTSTFSGPINLAGGADLTLTAAVGGQNNLSGTISGNGGISVAGGGRPPSQQFQH